MKLMIHEVVTESVIYGFEPRNENDTAKKAVDEYRKYSVMLTLVYKSPTSVFISRLMKDFIEELGQDNALILWRYLKDKGVIEVEFNRYGKMTILNLNEILI